jgi:hypothetical protein
MSCCSARHPDPRGTHHHHYLVHFKRRLPPPAAVRSQDFGSYAHGRNVTSPSSSVAIPLVTSISRLYEAEAVSFRGGTPAVPFPGTDGSPEYLAVGHLVANAQCFHHFTPPGVDPTAGPAAAAAVSGRGRGAPYCPTGYVQQRTAAGCSRGGGKPMFRSPLSAYVPMHHFEV